LEIRLDQKRALVTGGNSGIGAAIVLGRADAGAKVAINYVSHPETAESLAQGIKDRHGEALALPADVSDPQAVAQMFARIDEAGGGNDIVINNAGVDGAHEEVLDVLTYLQQTEQSDGHWSQNMWLDGRPYWDGAQMDETALPIL